MVDCLLKKGWSVEATAERFQVDAKTVRKWRKRFVEEGPAGLQDRTSRPRHSPNRTSKVCRRRVVQLRQQHRWGADHIAHELQMAASTVGAILRAEGLGRLDRGDRATNTTPPQRYQRERPGELIHVDVKKLAAIPDGGGWRTHGRGAANGLGRHSGAGYRYIHTAIDDRTRLAYSEILNDEQALTAAGFLARAVLWFSLRGVTIEEVLTDNGACYRSRLWRAACAERSITHRRTRPYRPQTNGKVERFHRILLEEWAYIRPWTSEADRVAGYLAFIHFYNHHRSHGALGWHTPTATLTHLQDNLPDEHT
jgi:transposase InsO family protein